MEWLIGYQLRFCLVFTTEFYSRKVQCCNGIVFVDVRVSSLVTKTVFECGIN